MGAVVEPGRHRVKLVFDPDSLRRGTQITLAALAGLVLLAMMSSLRRRVGAS